MLRNFQIRHCSTGKRNDGLVLLPVGRGTRALLKKPIEEYLIAIDRHGEITWQHELKFSAMDCRSTTRDTLLVMGTTGYAMEMALDGRVLTEWYCEDRYPNGHHGSALATPKIHHAICEVPGDLIASLSIKHLPLPCPDENWTHTMSDTLVLFDRAGKIEWELSLDEVLDINRLGYDTRIEYWPRQGWEKTEDWTHANGLCVDPSDGGFLISLRHQDAIIKLSRGGELVWILGHAEGWDSPWKDKLLRIEGGRPFYHQHDVSITANGELMLFDNGTAGAFPPTPRQPPNTCESFVLCYQIDEKAMTATETWRYGGFRPGVTIDVDPAKEALPDSSCYLPFTVYVSGVCNLPNGNRFIACTGITRDESGKRRIENPPDGVGSIQLFEITPAGETVYHAILEDKDAHIRQGWGGFRPEYLNPNQSSKLL